MWRRRIDEAGDEVRRSTPSSPAEGRTLAWLAVALGVVTMVIGFGYDIVFAGIPYQDPTPAMQARYDAAQSTAVWIMTVGLGIAAVGCLILLMAWIRRLLGRRTP